ncbi:Uncharacterized membrane protein YgdD, TMEM256/DUF423 family [Paenibacillus sp. 453mf]|nr:DUF423 domain-containing protein [Paenibacillus sp. 453mf]SFS56161.1 Uncharacterized membrane protein YgdD, TMEM256/DUF423 family [Paenibacillus sp. 453mf]
MQMLIVLGSILMVIAVAMGAFGAHALKSKFEEGKQKVYETAVQYHLIHALAIIVAGILAGQYPEAGLLVTAGWFMAVGIILFSGSLYILSLKKIRFLGPITPLGGISFIIAWILVAIGVM